MNALAWLSPSRWIGLALGVAALLAGYYFWSAHQQGIGYARAVAEYTAAAAESEKTQRAAERQIQEKHDEAIRYAKEQQTLLALDVGRARAAAGRLRDDLAAARRQLPGAACPAVRDRAAALTDVFEQCAGALGGMAEAADRHAADALTLRRAWPGPPEPGAGGF